MGLIRAICGMLLMFVTMCLLVVSEVRVRAGRVTTSEFQVRWCLLFAGLAAGMIVFILGLNQICLSK